MAGDNLSVKSMTQLTGLNEHTLRAWERRYGAVNPRRGDNGRRVYSRLDVERLRTMATLVERGFAIGRIAKLSDADLAELLSEHMDLDQANHSAKQDLLPTAETARASEIVEKVQSALLRFDLTAIHGDLQAARYVLGARGFALDLIAPLMDLVSRMTLAGRLTLGQEHALSAIVKAHLAGIILDLPRRQAVPDGLGQSAFVITTMEGNYNEIGIMIAGMLCALRGLSTFYLGPSLPAPAVADAVASFGAQRLLIGVSPVPLGTLAVSENDYLLELDSRLGPDCEIWTSGPTHDWRQTRLKRTVRYIKSLHEFDALVLGTTSKA